MANYMNNSVNAELLNMINKLIAELNTFRNQISNPPVLTNNIEPVIDYQMDETVQQFTGQETSFDAENWIQSVNNLARLNSWPAEYLLLYVRVNMAGAAESWYLSENFAGWEDFESKFRKQFVLQRCPDARRQGLNEQVVDYSHVKPVTPQPTSTTYLRQDFNPLSTSQTSQHLDQAQSVKEKIVTGKQWQQTSTVSTSQSNSGEIKKLSIENISSMKFRKIDWCSNCYAIGHFSRDCSKYTREPCHAIQMNSGQISRTQDSDPKPVILNDRPTGLIESESSNVPIQGSATRNKVITQHHAMQRKHYVPTKNSDQATDKAGTNINGI